MLGAGGAEDTATTSVGTRGGGVRWMGGGGAVWGLGVTVGAFAASLVCAAWEGVGTSAGGPVGAGSGSGSGGGGGSGGSISSTITTGKGSGPAGDCARIPQIMLTTAACTVKLKSMAKLVLRLRRVVILEFRRTMTPRQQALYILHSQTPANANFMANDGF